MFLACAKDMLHSWTSRTLLFEGDGSVADDRIWVVTKTLINETFACLQLVLLVLDSALGEKQGFCAFIHYTVDFGIFPWHNHPCVCVPFVLRGASPY